MRRKQTGIAGGIEQLGHGCIGCGCGLAALGLLMLFAGAVMVAATSI